MPKTKSSSQPAACSVRARGLRGSSSLDDKRIEGKDRSESSLEIRQPLKRKAESVSEVYLSISIRLTKSLIFIISEFGSVFDYGA